MQPWERRKRVNKANAPLEGASSAETFKSLHRIGNKVSRCITQHSLGFMASFTVSATLSQILSLSFKLMLIIGLEGLFTAWNCDNSVSVNLHGLRITGKMIAPSIRAAASKGGSSFSAINLEARKSALTSKIATFAQRRALLISSRHIARVKPSYHPKHPAVHIFCSKLDEHEDELNALRLYDSN